MGYIPLTNYKYASGPHQLQSGPNHEAFLVVSSGIVDIGADLGRIAPGIPNSGLWYVTDDFREVPRLSLVTGLTIPLALRINQAGLLVLKKATDL